METKPLEIEIGLLHERICSALGDPTRILILYMLAEKGMFVNEISEALNIPQSSVSRHLRICANATWLPRNARALLCYTPCRISASSLRWT